MSKIKVFQFSKRLTVSNEWWNDADPAVVREIQKMIGIDMDENLLNVEELIMKTIKDFNKNIIFEISRVRLNRDHTSDINGTCISLTANVKKDGINNTISKNIILTDEFIEIIEKEILCSFLLHKLNRFFGGYEILEVYDE